MRTPSAPELSLDERAAITLYLGLRLNLAMPRILTQGKAKLGVSTALATFKLSLPLALAKPTLPK